MTSTHANENRLTDTDRARMTERVAAYLDAQPMRRPIDPVAMVAAERLAWHAIGCDSRDFRECELEEIAAMVTALVDVANQARTR